MNENERYRELIDKAFPLGRTFDALLFPLIKLADWMVKRDLEKWARSLELIPRREP